MYLGKDVANFDSRNRFRCIDYMSLSFKDIMMPNYWHFRNILEEIGETIDNSEGIAVYKENTTTPLKAESGFLTGALTGAS